MRALTPMQQHMFLSLTLLPIPNRHFHPLPYSSIPVQGTFASTNYSQPPSLGLVSCLAKAKKNTGAFSSGICTTVASSSVAGGSEVTSDTGTSSDKRGTRLVSPTPREFLLLGISEINTSEYTDANTTTTSEQLAERPHRAPLFIRDGSVAGCSKNNSALSYSNKSRRLR